MVSKLLDPLLSLHGLPVYFLVGGLVFAEAAIFLGFVFPGETAVLLGGVLASEGHVNLYVLLVVVVVAAVAGDSVGFLVGRHFGPRLLDLRVLERRKGAINAATGLLRRRGPWAVILGRFTAFLRAMVPGLAGMSGMPYPNFLLANAIGGVLWGVGYTLLGYAVGHAYRKAEKYSSWASIGFLVLVVAAFVFAAVRSRRRERALEAAADGMIEPPRPAGERHDTDDPTETEA